jgi:hypothetical protein
VFFLICRILGRKHEIKMRSIRDVEGVKEWEIIKCNRQKYDQNTLFAV